MVIGLTGGMGCGKSTASRFFEAEGLGSIDADALVHELLATDEEVREAVAERFGTQVLTGEGRIDRRRLGERVFAHPKELEWLEQLLHPRVGRRWREETQRQVEVDWIVQIPLLFEKKLEESFDFTVCVGAGGEIQRSRLEQRGLSDREITRRLTRQFPLEEKIQRADFFLLNDGSLDFLQMQVAYLCRFLGIPRKRLTS